MAYFGNDAGTVTALGVRNSQPVWTYAAGSAVDSSVVVTSGLVIFGTTGGSVDAVSSRTGLLAWQTPTSSAVESSPSAADGLVFVGSDDGTVYALDQTTGAIAWQTKLAGSVTGSPSVDPTTGEVVVGDSSGAVSALSATTGAALWSVATGGPVTATTTIDSGDVFVGSQSGTVVRPERDDRSVGMDIPRRRRRGRRGAFWTDGFHPAYVVGDSHGDLYFLNLTTGAVQRLLTQETSAVTGVTTAAGLGGGHLRRR